MKIGICGTGDISHLFMKSIATLLDIQVSSVFHREMNKARIFANQYSINHYTDNLEALLNVVDTVYIALPNSMHFQYAKKCLIEGKHVIIEKPATFNVKQFDELNEIAHENKRMFFELNRVLSLPHFKLIKKEFEEMEGKIIMTLNYCKKSRRYNDFRQGLKPNVFTTEFAGGALYDLGIYLIHFVVGLKGLPLESSYYPHKLSTGVDGSGLIILKYKNLLVNATISKISNGESNFLIQAENKTIRSNSAVSLIRDFSVESENENIIINNQNEENMYYTIKDIQLIIKNNDIKIYNELLNHTRKVTFLLEKMRLDNDIIFESN